MKRWKEKKQQYFDAADRIWEHPETSFEEYFAADLLCSLLEKEGFAVTRPLAGMETAFLGRFGSGHPVIGILGEYDALYAMSQEADAAQPKPTGEKGHGCGHNLLGAGSLAAAVAVKDYLQENGKEGTVIYYGCPGEEGGSGKAFMAREGVFDGLDAALTWHPGDINAANSVSTLAVFKVHYHFTGRAAHAAACPQLGRSALDAAELMNIGTQFLREHIIPEARIHYAIVNAGGKSPNVVQPEAENSYYIRAPRLSQVRELKERVDDIARGAALMTGTSVDIRMINFHGQCDPQRRAFRCDGPQSAGSAAAGLYAGRKGVCEDLCERAGSAVHPSFRHGGEAGRKGGGDREAGSRKGDL